MATLKEVAELADGAADYGDGHAGSRHACSISLVPSLLATCGAGEALAGWRSTQTTPDSVTRDILSQTDATGCRAARRACVSRWQGAAG